MAEDEATWGERAGLVSWFRRPKVVRDETGWFPDGVLNTSFNALDRHVIAGQADREALVFASSVTGRRRTYSYAELLEKVAQLGGSLTAMGVRPGERVLISLPMVPEVIIAMLACARVGAVHAVVDAASSADDLAARIDAVRPVVIITASCVLTSDAVLATKPVLDAALQQASHQPAYCVVLQRPERGADMQAPRDLDFGLLMRPGSVEPATCVDVAATAPLFVLGDTTVDTGAYTVGLAWSLPQVHGVEPGEVIIAPTDLTTPTGHALIGYGPLIIGGTTVLTEGELGTDPDVRLLDVALPLQLPPT